MNVPEARRLMQDFDPLKTPNVLSRLWLRTEGDLMTCLRKILYRYDALALADQVEAHLPEARAELAEAEARKDKATATVDSLRGEYQAARAAISKMSIGTPVAERRPAEAQLREAARGLEQANPEAVKVTQAWEKARRRVQGMEKLIADLRGTEEPNPDVLRTLAEALAGALPQSEEPKPTQKTRRQKG